MALPESLQDRLGRRRFWYDYFFADWFDIGRGLGDGLDTEPEYESLWDTDYSDLEDCPVDLAFAPGCALELGLFANLNYITLSLLAPALPEPRQIASDDMAHWQPHVLRWNEVDLICRGVAALDPGLPHPGVPLLLLHRFAPLCLGDDAAARFDALRRAWRSLGLFEDQEIGRFVGRFDYRSHGFLWVEDERHGWTIRLASEKRWGAPYSSRRPGGGFPFEAFASAIEATRSLVGEPSDG